MSSLLCMKCLRTYSNINGSSVLFNPTAYWHKNRYTNWHMNRHTNRYTEYLPTQVNKNNIWHSKSVYQLAHHWHKNRYTDSCTDWCASWYTDSCAKYYFYLLELVNIRYTDSCADSCASWYTNSCAKGRRGVVRYFSICRAFYCYALC